MLAEERELLDESLLKIRAGRMTRRSFLEHAISLGLSSSAASKNVDASWTFIHYLLGADAQKTLTLSQARFATWQSVYDDTKLVAEVPVVKHLKPIFLDALPRPLSPVYSDMSAAIQVHVHQALTKQTSPTEAPGALQADLQTIISRYS